MIVNCKYAQNYTLINISFTFIQNTRFPKTFGMLRHIVKFYFVQLMIIDFHNIYLGAILRILTNALSSFKSPRKQILKTLPSIINQIQLFILAKSYVWKTPIVLILQSIYRNPKLIELRASLQNPIRKGIFL